MSKESMDEEYPEHLDNLSSFKREVWKDVIRNTPEVEVGVIDDIDLSRMLRDRHLKVEDTQDVKVAGDRLRKADKLEQKCAVLACVSFLMWSDDLEKTLEVSEEIINMAYKFNGRLYPFEENETLMIDYLDLTPLEEVMTGGIKRISKETGWEYKYFQELVFVFSKEGNGKDIF